MEFFCKKYKNTFLGENQNYNFSQILGSSYNKVALIVKSDKNKERVYLNEGLVLNQLINLNFNLLNQTELSSFSIILPPKTDLIVNISRIEVYYKNQLLKNLFHSDFKIFLKNGFIINNDIYNLNNYGNKIDFLLNETILKQINLEEMCLICINPRWLPNIINVRYLRSQQI